MSANRACRRWLPRWPTRFLQRRESACGGCRSNRKICVPHERSRRGCEHEQKLANRKWPALIALFASAILAACLPTLAQQQTALATSSNSMHAAAGRVCCKRRRRINRMLRQRRLHLIEHGLFLFLRAARIAIRPGDAPLQGDDSHVHIQDVKRGLGWQRRLRDEMQHVPSSRESSGHLICRRGIRNGRCRLRI